MSSHRSHCCYLIFKSMAHRFICSLFPVLEILGLIWLDIFCFLLVPHILLRLSCFPSGLCMQLPCTFRRVMAHYYLLSYHPIGTMLAPGFFEMLVDYIHAQNWWFSWTFPLLVWMLLIPTPSKLTHCHLTSLTSSFFWITEASHFLLLSARGFPWVFNWVLFIYF